MYESIFASMIEILLLVVAVSADTFAVSLSYGINRVKIPVYSLLVLSIISSGTLAASLVAGHFLSGVVSPVYAEVAGFCILFLMGIVKLLNRSSDRQADEADRDCDRILSPKESVLLGIILSLDSVAAGLCVGFSIRCILAAVLVSFPVTIVAILSGKAAGKRIAGCDVMDFSRIGGILLVILAFLKFS